MPADDLYWNPVDLDTEESSNFHKTYIDSWDLENYAYMRQHLDSLELSSEGSSGPREPVDMSPPFSYVHAERRPNLDRYGSIMTSEHTTTSNYAAIDEINAMRDDGYYKSRVPRPDGRRKSRSSYRGHEESIYYDDEDDTSRYMYERSRTQALNKIPAAKIRRRRSYSYSQGDYGYEPVSSVYSRLDDLRSMGEVSSPIYDDIRAPTPTPTNFGLSTYGHLKIDYSYSWNNLNKYIYH